MVVEIAKRKGSRLMRRLSLVMIGALVGAGTTALVSRTELLSSTSAVAA